MDKTERAAHELDQRITDYQQGRAAPQPQALEPALTELVDELLEVSQSIHPAPAFVDELEARLLHTALGTPPSAWRQPLASLAQSVRRAFQNPLRVAIVGALFALILALLLAVPTTRAALRSLLFGLAFTEPQAVEKQVIEVETPIDVPTGRAMTLAEIHALAPFRVKTPTWLPNNLDFTGGFVVKTQSGAQVSQVYHRGRERAADGSVEMGTPALLLVITSGEPQAPPLLPETEQEWVNVRGSQAVFVHGGWRAGNVNADGETLTDVIWDSELDDAWLTWQEDDLIYWMQADGLGLDASTMMQIAEALSE